MGGLFTLKLANGRRSENCGYVTQVKRRSWYSMAYGTIWSRMNELMNLDSDASQEQFNYIEDYRPSVRVFKDFISNITAHLGDIKTPREFFMEKKMNNLIKIVHIIFMSTLIVKIKI